MNQVQRNFLIKKIEDSAKIKKEALKSSLETPPNLSNYLLHAVMSGKFELRSTEEIKDVITQKALKSKERQDWLGNSWGSGNRNSVNFDANEIFIIPAEFKKLWDEYRENERKIDKEIRELSVQVDSLVTRIQLASDKTLQTMINEVDDMGNISLFDTKLKELTSIKSLDK